MANEIKRSAGADPAKFNSNGPFIARVVSHLDAKRMGALKVELLSFTKPGGQELFPPGQLFTAYYCSPFYGVNDVESNQKNFGYSGTQQSYGFWAVPPDPGTRVMVIFVENQPNQCYWIGCIQDEFMNHMVPGSTPTTRPGGIYQEYLSNDLKGKRLPTA